MSSAQVQQTIDFLENNGYVVVDMVYADGSIAYMCDINDESELDGIVAFNVMPLSEYEANGFQV